MIISQEKAFLKAQSQLQAICRFVERAATDGQRIDQAERELFSRLLAVGLTLIEAFVAAQGDGDAGAQLEFDNHLLHRLKDSHTRRYLSIFGELLIKRRVYARREGQKVERAPLDEVLGLPAGEFSYVLEDWLQRLCVKESFGEAVTSLRTILGQGETTIGVDHLARACVLEQIDEVGLGPVEQKYVMILADGPKRLNVIASVLGLPSRTVSQVTEPFLIRAGLVMKDDQGRRQLTKLGYEHRPRTS